MPKPRARAMGSLPRQRVPLDLKKPVLMLITDSTLIPDRSEMLARIQAAVVGGASLIQLREKHMPTAELLELAQKLRRIEADLIINGNLDVALQSDATGMHLPENSVSIAHARNFLLPGKLVGKSVHSLSQALKAQREGADYLIAGPIFTTSCKSGARPKGLAWLKTLTKRLHIPVLAVGGITPKRAKSAISFGACGVAIRSDILNAENPQKRAKDLCESMESLYQA